MLITMQTSSYTECTYVRMLDVYFHLIWMQLTIFTWLGRKVAIDASMSLYQFLIAVRIGEHQLTSSDGETTRHVICMHLGCSCLRSSMPEY